MNLIAKKLAMKNKEAQWRDEKTAACTMKWFYQGPVYIEVGDPTTVDAKRAKIASSSIREECVQVHAVSGELVPNDEVHHTEPCSNGVSKDDSDQSAVLPEGKPSNV